MATMRHLLLAALLVACDSPGGGGVAGDAAGDASAAECPEGQFPDGYRCRCINDDEQEMSDEGVCECINPVMLEAAEECIHPDSDDDLDGLTNREELDLGTLWYDYDTDNDGLDDGVDPTPTG